MKNLKYFLEMLYGFLSGGLSKGKPIEADETEIKMGMEVEKEHSSNPVIVHKIVMDHLVEHKDYYTRLKKAGL